jgi:hypothetical protein
MWKKMVMAHLKVIFHYFAGGGVRGGLIINFNLDKKQTGCLLNTSLGVLYCYTRQLGNFLFLKMVCAVTDDCLMQAM